MNRVYTDAQLAELVNAARAEAAALPRVVAWPLELPPLTEGDLAARRAEGWLAEGLFTAEEHGRLAALVDVRAAGERGQLGWFLTHPDCRRRSLAARCLEAALAYLKQRGVTSVETAELVDSRVPSACGFLEKHAFTVRDRSRRARSSTRGSSRET